MILWPREAGSPWARFKRSAAQARIAYALAGSAQSTTREAGASSAATTLAARRKLSICSSGRQLVSSSRNGYDKIVRAGVEPASERTIESSIRIYNVNGRLRNMRIRLKTLRPMHQPRPAPPATSKETRRPRSMLLRVISGPKVERYYKLYRDFRQSVFIARRP